MSETWQQYEIRKAQLPALFEETVRRREKKKEEKHLSICELNRIHDEKLAGNAWFRLWLSPPPAVVKVLLALNRKKMKPTLHGPTRNMTSRHAGFLRTVQRKNHSRDILR